MIQHSDLQLALHLMYFDRSKNIFSESIRRVAGFLTAHSCLIWSSVNSKLEFRFPSSALNSLSNAIFTRSIFSFTIPGVSVLSRVPVAREDRRHEREILSDEERPFFDVTGLDGLSVDRIDYRFVDGWRLDSLEAAALMTSSEMFLSERSWRSTTGSP